MITREQLRALGFERGAIEHRLKIGRLHPVRRGVYAVGRPALSREGRWMAAVLVCDDSRPGCGAGSDGGAYLSHGSAAATKVWVNGFEVDFLWRDRCLVVETDSLRHHRTPAQQVRDRLRDQAHAAAGFTPLRFTHEQVRYEPEHVRAVLGDVARRLGVNERCLPSP